MTSTTAHLPRIHPSHLSFAEATPVISAAQKFVIPVPAFADGGEPLVYPQGHPAAGQPITDWQGKPLGGQGIVFWNATDQTWAAAPGNGNAVIILNQVSEAQAKRLFERYGQLGDPEQLSLAAIKVWLAFATDELGVSDMYNSDRGFIGAHMTPVDPDRWVIEAFGETFGFLKRDARDVAAALFVDAPFAFDMAAPDRPVQIMDRGGVIVAIPSPKGEPCIHAVQPDVFVETYRLADGGRAITQLHRELRRIALGELALASAGEA